MRALCAVGVTLLFVAGCGGSPSTFGTQSASPPAAGTFSPPTNAPTFAPAASLGPVVPAAVLAANVTTRQVQAISVGWGICAIKLDGTLGCWGGASMAPSERTYIALSVGQDSSCAIRTDGQLDCWGYIGTAVPEGRFIDVDVEQSFACAIDTDHALTCWSGADPENGSPTITVTHPVVGTVADVSVSWYWSCALRTDGSVACWGEEGIPVPSIPSGTFSAIDVPCALTVAGELLCYYVSETSGAWEPKLGEFTQLSFDQTIGIRGCARHPDGTLACWGAEGTDLKGDDRLMRTPLGSYAAVSVGTYGACAVRADGRAVCWGESDEAVKPAPAAWIDGPRWVDSGTATLRWSSHPLFAPVTGYDLEVLTVLRYDGAPPPVETEPEWTPWLSMTTGTTGTLKSAPGTSTCAQVRAHDADGATSPWTETCTTFPLDDRALRRSAGWAELSGSRFYLGTALRTTRQGAVLTLPGVSTGGLGLVVTTCPTCGTIELIVDGQPWEGPGFSLRSTRTIDRDLVLWSDNGQEGFSGTVTIKVVSSGKPVIIDGVLLGPGPDD